MSPYTIVLADDHALFRGGVKRIIKEDADLEVIGEAGDGLELLTTSGKSNPNMVILDISMPNLRGLEAAREIRKMYPQIHILLLTMHKKKEFIQQGIAGGRRGSCSRKRLMPFCSRQFWPSGRGKDLFRLSFPRKWRSCSWGKKSRNF